MLSPSLGLGIKQEYPLPTSISYCKKNSSQFNKVRKRNKGMKIRKEEEKEPLFSNDMIMAKKFRILINQ